MTIIFTFTIDHTSRTVDENTAQTLGVRLFNAAGTGLHLASSGYYQTAFHQARDIMETGFLLDYFRTSPCQIFVWLTARGGFGELGPFVEPVNLKAWLEEMVLRFGPAAVMYANQFPDPDPRFTRQFQEFGTDLITGFHKPRQPPLRDRGKPRDEDTEGGNQPADKSLIIRRLSLRSQLCAAKAFLTDGFAPTGGSTAPRLLTANIRARRSSPQISTGWAWLQDRSTSAATAVKNRPLETRLRINRPSIQTATPFPISTCRRTRVPDRRASE